MDKIELQNLGGALTLGLLGNSDELGALLDLEHKFSDNAALFAQGKGFFNIPNKKLDWEALGGLRLRW